MSSSSVCVVLDRSFYLYLSICQSVSSHPHTPAHPRCIRFVVRQCSFPRGADDCLQLSENVTNSCHFDPLTTSSFPTACNVSCADAFIPWELCGINNNLSAQIAVPARNFFKLCEAAIHFLVIVSQTTLQVVDDQSWDPLESTCRHASLSIL